MGSGALPTLSRKRYNMSTIPLNDVPYSIQDRKDAATSCWPRSMVRCAWEEVQSHLLPSGVITWLAP